MSSRLSSEMVAASGEHNSGPRPALDNEASDTAALDDESVPRPLSPRQAETVQKLADATLDELRAGGFDELSVRGVAKRAGVAAATAYTYFSSREHLVAEAYWRRLRTMPSAGTDRRLTRAHRAAAVLGQIAEMAADEPELASAATVAMLSTEAGATAVRQRIGWAIRTRLIEALGEDCDPAELIGLELLAAGGLVNAGGGHLSYDQLPDIFRQVAERVVAP